MYTIDTVKELLLKEPQRPEIGAVAFAHVEDTDVGAITFFDWDGNHLAHFEGRGRPELTGALIAFVKSAWRHDEAQSVEDTCEHYARPCNAYRVRLAGSIFDGEIIVETLVGEPAENGAGYDLAARFNNHPERLSLLAAAGKHGAIFIAWLD